MSNRTLEEEYNYIKAQFIELSKAIHLGYNTHDPLFTVAADAVRSVFNVEPINNGARRSTLENRATQALIGIMKTQTDILDSHLAKLIGKKEQSIVYRSYEQHCNAYATEEKYRIRFNQALYNYFTNTL